MKTDAKNFSDAQAQRLRHYQGERLSAADLQDEYDNQSWLRSLHVVALHNTWGIVRGLEVHMREDVIRVAPGLAYDCFGREIILSTAAVLSWPSDLQLGDAGIDLVLRYHDEPDIGMGAQQAASALCPPRGERPAFVWQPPAQTRLGRDIPLLRLVTVGESLALDLEVRRYTQALARPHIGSGHTPPTQQWKLVNLGSLVFLQTDVDTINAGFVSTPFYVTTLSCHLPPAKKAEPAAEDMALDVYTFANLLRTRTSDVSEASDPGFDLVPYLLTGIAYPPFDASTLQTYKFDSPNPLVPGPPSATGFTYRILLHGTRGQFAAAPIDQLTRHVENTVALSIPFLSVAWLGIEAGGTCRQPSSSTNSNSCLEYGEAKP